MDDIVPDLLENIQHDFLEAIKNDTGLKRVKAVIDAGEAGYSEANDYAIKIGEALSNAFKQNLSSDVLPDGRMYFNIADRILNTTLGENHRLISDITTQVQKSLNEKAGVGIKAIRPELNQDRIEGLVNRISSEEDFDRVSWLLDEPVVNFSQSIVDDSIKENADFHYRSGLSPKIVRISTGKCCPWCDKLAGTYEYHTVKNTGNDVFRRHERCRCTVDYVTADGKRQDVWSKKKKNQTYQNPLQKAVAKMSANKTLAEAQNYAVNTLGLSMTDYTKVNVDIANAINTEIKKAFSTFADLKNSGKLNGFRVYPKKSQFYAAYAPNSGIVWVKNVGSKSAFGKLRSDAIDQFKSGFWSSSNKEHAFRHELGHAIEHAYCDSRPDKKAKISALFQAVKRDCGISSWSLSATEKEMLSAGKKLSYYGLKDEGEFIAESVAEYLSGKSRETANKVIEILLEVRP